MRYEGRYDLIRFKMELLIPKLTKNIVKGCHGINILYILCFNQGHSHFQVLIIVLVMIKALVWIMVLV